MVLTILLIIHVLTCVLLMAAILMQAGKGGGLSGSLGGFGIGQNLFGSAGSVTFLIKATTILAVLFFLTTMSIGYIYSRGKVKTSYTGNLIQDGLIREQKEIEKQKESSSTPTGQSPAVKGTGKKPEKESTK